MNLKLLLYLSDWLLKLYWFNFASHYMDELFKAFTLRWELLAQTEQEDTKAQVSQDSVV